MRNSASVWAVKPHDIKAHLWIFLGRRLVSLYSRVSALGEIRVEKVLYYNQKEVAHTKDG